MFRKLSLIILLLTSCQFALADKTFDNVMAKAKTGDAEAQNYLGILYGTGVGVTQDYKQAFLWTSKAAQQSDPYAQMNLARMYYDGTGTSRDFKQAFAWYNKAAVQGWPEAQFELANMFYRGEAVTQNYKQAANWFESAAKQNWPQAQYSLGYMYFNGEGVQKDNQKAYIWFSVAAANGDSFGLDYRNNAAATLTKQQLDEAQAKAAELMKKIEENKAAKK